MIIENFSGFKGQHCETVTTGSLLKSQGIELSEPMLFGLGEGLSFIFWNMKNLDFPFLGGRVKPEQLTQNLCKNLNLQLEVLETTSTKKAWQNVVNYLDNGIPVGLKLDCYYLDYFSSKIHFAGHYVAMYGYDSEYAYVVDTFQQGMNQKTKLQNLEKARSAKGAMSSKNLSYTLKRNSESFDLGEAVKTAIKNNANEYLNPPISNISYKGIKRTATEVLKWYKLSQNVKYEFETSARLMERGGTGGAIFRNFYRDFLKESYNLLGYEQLDESFQIFKNVAIKWTKVAELFTKTAEINKVEPLEIAAEILKEISVKEKSAMELLSTI